MIEGICNLSGLLTVVCVAFNGFGQVRVKKSWSVDGKVPRYLSTFVSYSGMSVKVNFKN